MPNKRYYHSEVIEFQNGDQTVAKQLTIKKLRVLNDLFSDHDAEQRKHQKRIEEEVERRKKESPKTRINEQEVLEEMTKVIQDEGGKTYLDTLTDGALIALNAWGVKDARSKNVEVDIDYVEENLDYPTMARICEIAGSMELGDKTESGDEGKD